MLKNILTSLLLLGFLGNSASAAMGRGNSPLQEAFLRAANSLSQEEISQRLKFHSFSSEEDLEEDLKEFVGPGKIYSPKLAHDKGLIFLATSMINTGAFFDNYKKIILSSLSDFKKYAQGNNPYSLKEGQEAPLLFVYVDQNNRRIPVTTYSFAFLILGILDERGNRHFEDMNLMRQQGVIEKLKQFLESLSRGHR
jgi:hypothetical protein